MKLPSVRRLAGLLTATPVALTLGACTVGPNFEAPSWASPTAWFGSHGTDASPAPQDVSLAVPQAIDPHWWREFHDPELSSLVERTAAGNLDVRLATIRIAESRAQRGQARAAEFPTVTANTSYSRERLSQDGEISLLSGGASTSSNNVNTQANGGTGTSGGIPSSITGGTKIPPFNLYQYGFDASWELDLWGRVRRSVENADASLQASAESRRASTLTAIAEVARDYLELRGYQTQLAIAKENLATAKQSLELTRQRYVGGLTTDLDVQNASAQVRTTSAQIPQLEQQQDQMINAISFLLGLQPRALRDELIAAKPVPPVPPRVPVGLPSELARRRPDIRQAEAQLHAATAEIGVAVAAFYPSVSLSGSFSIQALDAKQLGDWNARQYGLGPVINLPIFQGGQLKATLELRKAQQQEAAAMYQRTVLNAWHEVENALVAYNAEQLRRTQLEAAVGDSRRALALAQSRYTAGLIEFLQVLDDQRTLLNAQLQLAQSSTTVATNLVALYNALGGGWEADYPDTARTMAAATAGDRS